MWHRMQKHQLSMESLWMAVVWNRFLSHKATPVVSKTAESEERSICSQGLLLWWEICEFSLSTLLGNLESLKGVKGPRVVISGVLVSWGVNGVCFTNKCLKPRKCWLYALLAISSLCDLNQSLKLDGTGQHVKRNKKENLLIIWNWDNWIIS